MLTIEVFKARAFRLALAFCLAVSVATAAAFGLIYLQVSSADVQRAGAILVDEAAKSVGDSEAGLRQALELRLTRDIRRLDYVALFDANGTKLFGNVPAMPAIPVDGRAHVVRAQALPDASGAEPAIFVARRRPDGGVMLLGRSLREAYELQEIVLRALAIAILPMILLILAISAILRISALEHSARETHLTEFDLGAVCNQVFDLYEPLAESKFMTMDIDADKPVPVRGDEDLMREAISNLVDNAIKFSPPGGAVRIEARTQDGCARASVSDTGRGIPPRERARVFRRFYRGEQSSDTTGHGLGLSIAESISRLHGFELAIEDNDPGARFVMRGPEKVSSAPGRGQTLTPGLRTWARS